MATQPVYDKPVSVEDYLSMEFEHDCEYVDGKILERNPMGWQPWLSDKKWEPSAG